MGSFDCCVRELVLREGVSLQVAEQHDGLDGEAGVVVWDAALVLAHYLAAAVDRGRLRLAGARVLELGAGTGCAGLAAAALGAAEVVLTDRPQLLPLLRHNVEARCLALRRTLVLSLPSPPLQRALDALLRRSHPTPICARRAACVARSLTVCRV